MDEVMELNTERRSNQLSVDGQSNGVPECHRWGGVMILYAVLPLSFFILFPYILLWTYFCYISFYLHTASCAASFLLMCSYAQSVYSCAAVMHSLFTLAHPLCIVCLLMRSLIVQYIRTGWTLLFLLSYHPQTFYKSIQVNQTCIL